MVPGDLDPHVLTRSWLHVVLRLLRPSAVPAVSRASRDCCPPDCCR